LAIVATLCLFLLVRAGRAGSGQPPASSSPEFVGAQACASCHRQMYDTWQSGRHSKMLQPATASSVVGDFSKSSVTLTGKLQEHRVEHTLGSRRIQHYLTTIDKGWIVLLPPRCSRQIRCTTPPSGV
jgi:hypothetical protein